MIPPASVILVVVFIVISSSCDSYNCEASGRTLTDGSEAVGRADVVFQCVLF